MSVIKRSEVIYEIGLSKSHFADFFDYGDVNKGSMGAVAPG